MDKASICRISGKNADMKKKLLNLCINDGDYSVADLSQELNSSIPTTTKLVGELVDAGLLEDLGKHGNTGGRRPNIYGLNPNVGYLVGINVSHSSISIAVTDFKGHLIDSNEFISFSLKSNIESFKEFAILIKQTLKKMRINMEDILTCGINLSGRVNCQSGYCFSYFISEEFTISDFMQKELGCHVSIENDSRAMAYAEQIAGISKGVENSLFINMGWGLGMGMVLNGKLNYGKSGFSGEFGHFPMLNNGLICRCGKTGCLETEASGSAIHRILLSKLKEGAHSSLKKIYDEKQSLDLQDILKAVEEEDVLAIEVLEMAAQVLGRALSGLMKIFNPDMIVLGGKLSVTGNYLLLPALSEMNKYSFSILRKDTEVKLSSLGSLAGPLGACLLSRKKMLEL